MNNTRVITTLQRVSRGYTFQPLANGVGIRVSLDPDLFDRESVDDIGVDYVDACRRGLDAAMACRNGRPRLVSITRIAGLEELEVAS